jgi:anaerobic selenocysteine-containing dehydrogenase
MEVYSTACPRNCYSTCSFKVVVENGRIIHFEPHPGNLATPEGMCLKGLSYKEKVESPDRILHPMKRIRDGSFRKVTWDKILVELAEKLQFFRDGYGPQSILFYESSGMSGLLNEISSTFWNIFGGATTTYGNLCWPAGLEAIRLTLGENKHNVPWDLEHARLIIMWGKNTVETNVQESIPLEKALVQGAHLVVIDPRRTPTADKAHLLIQPRPGTDGALALAVAKILIENEWIDFPFIQKYVSGFEAFRHSLESCGPEWAENITGIPVHAIRHLAQLMGTIKPMTILPGYGMQRYTNGGQTIRCLLALQVLSGNIGKPGACFHYANLQSYVFDKVREPLSYYPWLHTPEPFRRTVSKATLGRDMLAQKDPELRMIWVERGNPITQNPDTKAILKAFRKLDYRVVIEQFMTDTAIEADVILPAKTMFEQTDLIGSYWNPYVQLRQKVIEPPGEVKTETEIYRLLGERLHFPDAILEKEFPANNGDAIEDWLRRRVSEHEWIDFGALKKGPMIPPDLQHIAFEDFKFNTPSGTIELYSETIHSQWGVDPLPAYESPAESDGIAGTQERKRFYFLTPNTKNRIHSQFGNLEVIRQFDPEPLLEMNLHDAQELGIQTGDWVRVFNDRGEIRLKTRLHPGILTGCVALPNGWWKTERGGGNRLSAQRETDIGHGTAFHDNLVEIEKL